MNTTTSTSNIQAATVRIVKGTKKHVKPEPCKPLFF
jgi:hypothetical protein